MPTWKLNELRQLIEEQHSADHLQKANPHIDSVDWKIRAASYHSYAASNAFSAVFKEKEPPPSVVVKMMLTNGKEATDFYEARLIYEANVIACAQAMHSVSDIISHVILDSLAIRDADEENLDLKSIQKLLPESLLKSHVVRILGLDYFRYLQDFVNTSKHVRLVGSQYTVDLTGVEKIPHGVKFRQFECKGRPHKEKWGETFLQEMRQLSIEYVHLGCALNDYMVLAKS
jgi:hypothetical protein